MTFKQIRIALYALYLTNLYGFKLKRVSTVAEQLALRYEYSSRLFERLKISVTASGLDKIDPERQYLLLSNHRSIIDPCIIEIALRETGIMGHWVSKKELYNSFFFGVFVRNAGSILLDREAKNMGGFFAEIKNSIADGASVFIFPEGTRNKEDTPLSEFKKGTELIAMKNRLPMLPVHISTNSRDTLIDAIKHRPDGLNIHIEIGDEIDYKDRSMPLEQRYREMFALG